MPEIIVCDRCGYTFVSERAEGDAMQEYRDTFPTMVDEERSVLCEECYTVVMDQLYEAGLVEHPYHG